jgi:DNA-directed RNA polymerase specialized sigma24 family protein
MSGDTPPSPSSSPSSPRFTLDARALRRLLDQLDSDPLRASQRYETLRRSLIKVFAWEQQSDSEALADDVLDRVARRLNEGVAIADVIAYAQRTAELVLMEARRRARRREALAEGGAGALLPMIADPLVERRHDCLERCLNSLGAEARDLVLRYYAHDGRARIEQRDALAREQGLSVGALRNRMLRLREKLESCVRSCLALRDRSLGDDTYE